jgi:hypothetical protein
VSLLPLLPVVALLVGTLCAGIALGRLLDEAEQLNMELQRARRLRPLFAQVTAESQRLRLALARLQRRP